MKDICSKCHKSKVTFIQGKSRNQRATGMYIPCDCKVTKEKKLKMVYDNLERDSKIKKNGYVKYRN